MKPGTPVLGSEGPQYFNATAPASNSSAYNYFLDSNLYSCSQSYGYPDSNSYRRHPQYAAAPGVAWRSYDPPTIKEPDLQLHETSADPYLPRFSTSDTLDAESLCPDPAQGTIDGTKSVPVTTSVTDDEDDRPGEMTPTRTRVPFRLARCTKAQKDCMRDILQKEIQYVLRTFNGEFSAGLIAAALAQIHTKRLERRVLPQGDPRDVLHRFSKDQQRKLHHTVAETPRKAKRALQTRKIEVKSSEDINRALLALRVTLVGLEENLESQRKSQ